MNYDYEYDRNDDGHDLSILDAGWHSVFAHGAEFSFYKGEGHCGSSVEPPDAGDIEEWKFRKIDDAKAWREFIAEWDWEEVAEVCEVSFDEWKQLHDLERQGLLRGREELVAEALVLVGRCEDAFGWEVEQVYKGLA